MTGSETGKGTGGRRMAPDEAMDEALIESLFAAARARPPAPSDTFLARVMADADRVLDERRAAAGLPARPPARAAAQTGRRGWIGQVAAALGGWGGIGGLATACCAGLWLGLTGVGTGTTGLLWSAAPATAGSQPLALDDFVQLTGE